MSINKDISLEIEGMGIVMYSLETVKGIPDSYWLMEWADECPLE